jgi:hypothetical protein
MRPNAKSCVAQSLALPAKERAALAHHLIASLGAEDDLPPELCESLWQAEITQRAKASDAGLLASHPAAEIIKAARQRLA